MRIRGVISILLAGVLFISSSAPSLAAGVALPKEDVVKIRSGLRDLGVDLKTQDQLIKKLEKGIAWDSLIESSKPISNTTQQLSGETVERMVFADGSVAISQTQNGLDLRSNLAMLVGSPESSPVSL
ncbi:hypothetical protein [Glutamicibacter sp. JC586]|uniref:hypothetical protein n=1 Tax=Glutamicibacter sp. JC586 TaxID=2590552 RepID=UPI001358230B|nr:hypothetical protein [Glutamicibacter sp. JC586]